MTPELTELCQKMREAAGKALPFSDVDVSIIGPPESVAFLAMQSPKRTLALLDALEEAGKEKWIDVKEELPPDPAPNDTPIEQYLISFFNKDLGPYVTAAYYAQERWWEEVYDRELSHLTVYAWRRFPLPAAPDTKETK